MRSSTKAEVRAGISDWNWAAIAAGVVVALAIQVLFMWLGDSVASSLGNRQPERGFEIWTVVVQLVSLFLGAGFAAYLARATSIAAGAALGAFTWALALVLGSGLARHPFAAFLPENTAAAAWTVFLGGLLSLGTAMFGGIVGGRRRHDQPTSPLTEGVVSMTP